jgi:hypothetical protein
MTEEQNKERELNKNIIETCQNLISSYYKTIRDCEKRIKELEGHNLWKNINFNELKSGKYRLSSKMCPDLAYVTINNDPTGRIYMKFYTKDNNEHVIAEWYLDATLKYDLYIFPIEGEEYGGSYNECYG